MAFSPCCRYIYAACSGTSGNRIGVFLIKKDNALEPLNFRESGVDGPCHISANGGNIFCSGYASGSFSVFALNPDGSAGEMIQLVKHAGCSVNATRQTAPHVHQTVITPDGSFLCVSDLGTDRIVLYPLTPCSGVNPAEKREFAAAYPGDGPRHAVFNPAGNMAYSVNELANTVAVWDYRDGFLKWRCNVSTLPAGYHGFSKASAIRLSRDGDFLAVSNRGYDSLAVFHAEPDGSLEPAGIFSSSGESPRDFDFIGDGSMIAVANENSNLLTVMHFDRISGRITPSGMTFAMPRPSAVLSAFA